MRKTGNGRAPCCDKSRVKSGPWSPEEDLKLTTFVQKNGHENWRSLPKLAGLSRCGKSCRLRWINYLRPDLKRGSFSQEEEKIILELHDTFGNKWSKIAASLPGRTDNEIKNVWNKYLKKRKEQKAKNPDHEQSFKEFDANRAQNNILLGKRRAESPLKDEHQSDQGHVPKQLRQSYHGAVKESDKSIKDMSRSCSFSSNNSSVVINSGQPDQDHDATIIRSEKKVDGHQRDTFFELGKSYDFGTNILEEVNKPEFISGFPLDSDFPLESDFDIWLETSFPFNSIQSLEDGSANNNNNDKEVAETKKWLQYLENELGLGDTEDQDQEKNSSKESDHH